MYDDMELEKALRLMAALVNQMENHEITDLSAYRRAVAFLEKHGFYEEL